jgi:hypothetical protein
VSELGGGWTGTGEWSGGALLLDDTSVRLLGTDGASWTETSRIDLVRRPTSAAVSGSILVVMTASEVLTYDVTDPAAPGLLAVHPGSSHLAVEPLGAGEVLLWSPRMAAPPVRWNAALEAPGSGFEVVWDGLP